ncbi:hypothetical protein EYS10_09480 [Rahnella aquatilis]|nr:hypothetical protein EYS10_09480 [Rahnella aquatilis]
MKKFADSSKDDINQWFVLCREKQQPYVYIVPKRKYAVVEWDYMQFDKAIEANMRLKEHEIHVSIVNLLKSYKLKNYRIGNNPLVWTLRGVLIEDAMLIAEELYDLFNKYAYQDNSSLAIVE